MKISSINTLRVAFAITACSLVTSLKVNAQGILPRTNHIEYRNISLMAGPSLYSKIQVNHEFGSNTVKAAPYLAMDFGIDYEVRFTRRPLSISTGLWFVQEPVYRLRYYIASKDLPEDFTSDLNSYDKGMGIVTASVPLMLNRYHRLSENNDLVFSLGYRMLYLPPGSFESTVIVSSDSIATEVFGIMAESQERFLYHSALAGVGYSRTFSKCKIKAKLIYVHNFQNTMNGQYLYDNLAQSPRSEGRFTTSGDHLSLQVSVTPAKGLLKDLIRRDRG